MRSRVWKNIFLFCDTEGWISACFVPCIIQTRFFQSVTNTASCQLCCLSCRRRNVIFAFIPFFLAIQWGQKKVVNIEENIAVKLNKDKSRHLRVIEWFRLEGPFQGCLVQTPAQSRDSFKIRLLRAPSNHECLQDRAPSSRKPVAMLCHLHCKIISSSYVAYIYLLLI